MAIFDFKSIPSCLQHWLPIITETSKIQCRMVIPRVLSPPHMGLECSLDSSLASELALGQRAELEMMSRIWLPFMNCGLGADLFSELGVRLYFQVNQLKRGILSRGLSAD